MNYGENNPRTDSTATEAVINYLIARPFEWCHPGAALFPGTDAHTRCCFVRDSIEVGRKAGLVIEGSAAGYRLMGWTRPARTKHAC